MKHSIKIQNQWYKQIGEAEQIAGRVVIFDIHLGKRATCPKVDKAHTHSIGFIEFRIARVIKTGSGKNKRATIILAALA